MYADEGDGLISGFELKSAVGDRVADSRGFAGPMFVAAASQVFTHRCSEFLSVERVGPNRGNSPPGLDEPDETPEPLPTGGAAGGRLRAKIVNDL